MNLAATMSLSAGAFLGPLAGVRGQLAGLVGSVAALGGVTLSVAGFVHGLRDALDLGSRLSDLSARTGIAVDELLRLEQAFRISGVSAELVGPSINLMQRALAGISEAGEATQAVFARLGLDMADLRQKAPTVQLAQIAEKLRALPNVAQQSAAAMAIFGRSGAQLLPFLKDAEALTAAAVMIGRQGEILRQNANQFDRASDILASAPVKLRGFFVGAAESISASLLASLEQVNQFDFSTLGQKFGAAIAPYLEGLKSGRLWEVVRLQFTQVLATSLAKVAQLLVVDIPALLFAGISAPILWAVEHLKRGFNDVMASFAEKWNKIAPKKLQIDPGTFANDTPARTLGDRFNTQLAKMPQVDWGRDVNAWFQPAIEDVMGALNGAAQQSLKVAQALGAAPVLSAVTLGPEAAGKGKAAEPASDRLARIGGFIGGGGGPALDYSRRTADNTAKLVQRLAALPRDLASALGGGASTPAYS